MKKIKFWYVLSIISSLIYLILSISVIRSDFWRNGNVGYLSYTSYFVEYLQYISWCGLIISIVVCKKTLLNQHNIAKYVIQVIIQLGIVIALTIMLRNSAIEKHQKLISILESLPDTLDIK